MQKKNYKMHKKGVLPVEVIAVTILILLGNLLRAMKGDDPDKKKRANIVLNLLNRAKGDATFYTSNGALTMINTVSPALIWLGNFVKFQNSLINWTIGGDDEIHSGINAGESRVVIDAMRAFPGFSSYYRMKHIGEREQTAIRRK